jgi:hypothetical protein
MTGSNRFGGQLTDRQTFTGSVLITGSLTVNTTGTEFQVTNAGVVMGNLLTDNHSVTGSFRVTGSGTFTSTISAIGESTLFQGAYNDPVPNTVAVLKMSSTPTPSLASTVVGARMSGNATANVDTYAGYFSNISTVSGTGLSYGIFATASFHTFIGETRFAQGVFNDPINGTVASIKISATPRSGAPTAVFTTGITGTASSGQNTFAGYFTNTSTVSGGGVNYGIFATGSNHFFGGNVGIGTTTPTQRMHIVGVTGLPAFSGTSQNGTLRLQTSGYGTVLDFGAEGPATGKQWLQATDSSSLSVYYPLLLNPRGGNVGIGTTSPAAQLEVSSSSSSGIFLASTSNVWTTGFMDHSNFLAPNMTGGSVSVAIGKSASTYNLGKIIYTYGGNSSTTSSLGLGFFDADNKLVIQAGGNVGIGTTTPTTKLFVLGAGSYNTATNEILASDATIFSSEMSNDAYNSILQLVSVRQSLSTGASSNGFLGFSTIDDSNGEGIRDAGRIAIVNENGTSRNSATALSFWTNTGGTKTTAATEKMRITSAGNVAIGGTSPTAIFDVLGSSSSTRPTFYMGQGGYGQIAAQDKNHAIILRGYPTNYTNYAVQAADVISFCEYGDDFRFYRKTDANDMQIQVQFLAGTIYARSTTVQSLSDIRIKENIRNSEEGLNIITGLRPVRFDFKEGYSDGKKNQLGFIAQEVEEIFPDAISQIKTDIEGEEPLKTMGPGALIPVLVKAVQEQQILITELTEKVKALENK